MTSTHKNLAEGREALRRVEPQWGRAAAPERQGRHVNHFYVTHKRVAETEAFEEELVRHLNVDLVGLGQGVRMKAMKLKRRAKVWPTAVSYTHLTLPTKA